MNGNGKNPSNGNGDELRGKRAERLITDDADDGVPGESELDDDAKERVRNAFLSAYAEQRDGGPSLRGFIVVVLIALVVVLALAYGAMRT